jgi:hypothetical protein
MNRLKWFLLIFVNFTIAAGFYISNLEAQVEDISSDLANIIPICKKIDNPKLYQNDLYLDNIEDVEYYTPFFVQSLRFFAKFVEYDYLQALNLLSFCAHFIYGLSWFMLLFSLKKDYWLALFFSVFIRGILWPPGAELLGISDLWTIMPRTVYSAFLPIPFLIYFKLKKYNLIVASFVLGLIFNFHPITGLGGIILYFSIFVLYNYYLLNEKILNIGKKLLTALLFCFIGMLPFIITYATKVDNVISFDQALFNKAFLSRIPSKFNNPIRYILDWNGPIMYFFGILFIVYYFFDSSKNKVNFKILFISSFVLFFTANFSVYIENLINILFNKNIRMSFQLIRYQKLIIILFQIGLFLMLIEIFKLLSPLNKYKPYMFFGYLVLLFFSTSPLLSRFPIIGDDLTTSVLPKSMSCYSDNLSNYNLSKMIDYVKKNTENDAVFYGSYLIRTGANKSVILDSKGAGMLIEGNPAKFINWYNDKSKFKTLSTNDKIAFLKNKNADYIIDDKSWDDLKPIKKIGDIYLYKINFDERD